MYIKDVKKLFLFISNKFIDFLEGEFFEFVLRF